MPRRNAGDNDKPRRRRAATAGAAAERGILMRILLLSPKDTIAGALAFAILSAIMVNALFLQAGRHPAPMFGSVVMLPEASPANPIPRPRPVEASVRPEVAPPESKPAEPRAADPLTNLVKATSEAPVATSNVSRPPAGIPAAPHSEASVHSDIAPRGGGTARPHRIRLRPVETDRRGQCRHPGRDPAFRASAPDSIERPNLRAPATRTLGDGRPSDRLTSSSRMDRPNALSWRRPVSAWPKTR